MHSDSASCLVPSGISREDLDELHPVPQPSPTDYKALLSSHDPSCGKNTKGIQHDPITSTGNHDKRIDSVEKLLRLSPESKSRAGEEVTESVHATLLGQL